ncbi:hypothetical protein KDH_12430 [Dictyobacter sp. S3.2.2.5]|uniref:Helix-turn-helix domain-containing protein n=1 Tax=Dictyobacter halimunensis TaxID=3026934 RepID=A0ABQ6FJK0_9CHLR|nr:hypothetical protein KDH_12430 [Dictyobacter sp. S3.2.2.5]
MKVEKRGSSSIARYITVQDAVERLGVVERTVRRWIEKDKLHAIRDVSGSVRLDLDEVELIVQERGAVVPSPQQQIEALLECVERLKCENEALFECVERLKRENEARDQKCNDLQQQIDVIRQERVSESTAHGHGSLLLPATSHFLHSHSGQELLARRGLPEGTMRLVQFAQLHQIKLSDLKKLHMLHAVNLTIYQREAEAIRNKQEWWITPEQHQQVADYCQQHDVPYVVCSQCSHEGVNKDK